MYFQAKFLSRELSVKYPVFESNSKLLNQYYLHLFYLAHSHFQEVEKLKLLYNGTNENINFFQITKKLQEFDGSTLIVIKHNELIYNFQDKDHSYQPYIFGGFRAGKWRNEQKFQGNKNCFIFSIEPKFQIFFPNKIKENEPGMHCYLNTSSTANFPIGIGFGGNAENQRFRIWIDEDMQIKSYCTSKDETYDDGIIAMNNISEFKINEIEIWGVPTTNFEKTSYIAPVNQQQAKLQSPTDLLFSPIIPQPQLKQLNNDINLYTSNKQFTLDNKDFNQKYQANPEIKENVQATINYDFEKKKLLNFTETQSFVLKERKTDNLNIRSQIVTPMNIEDLIRQSEIRFNKEKLSQLQQMNDQNMFIENDQQESKNLTFGENSNMNKYSTKSQNVI